MEEQEKKIAQMDKQELIHEYNELLASSVRDSMTGLLNRTAAEQEIQKRILNKRYDEKCALFIIDLDNFKIVNDTYGHQAGDEIIRKAAKRLSETFCAVDIVARLGGDEFFVFMSGNLTEEDLKAKAQTVCEKIRFVFGGETEQLAVTCSIGICFNAQIQQSFDYFYSVADTALYEVKKSGKQGYCIKSEKNPADDKFVLNNQPVNVMHVDALLDSTDSGIGLVELSKYFKFIYANPVLARMLNSTVGELMGASVLDFIHPDDREKIEPGLQKQIVGEGEPSIYEVRLADKSEKETWCKIYAVRIPDNDNKPVVFITVTDITDLKKKESDLKLDNFLFQSVLEHTTKGIWEVEPSTHMFRMISDSEYFDDDIFRAIAFPEGLIALNWIAEESVANFRLFAREIFEGKTQSYANFKIKHRFTDEYKWATFSYSCVFKDDVPVKIIGVIERMENFEQENERSVKGTMLPRRLMDSLVLQASGNLTANTMYRCFVEGRELSDSYGLHTCTDFFDSELERIYINEEISLLTRLLSRDAMLRMYKNQKNTWMVQEYRRVDSTGNIQWVSCVLNIYENPHTDEVLFAMWQNKLNNRRKWEYMFNVPIYKEPINKLYTALSVREIASRLVSMNKEKLCALAVIEICGMDKLKNEADFEKKHAALLTALSLALGTDCIPGQINRDRLVIFFPEIPSEISLRKKIEQSFAFVRGVINDFVDVSCIRFIAGAACGYQSQTDYKTLLDKATHQYEFWSGSETDCVTFAEDKLDDGLEIKRGSDEDETVRIADENGRKPLPDAEQALAFKCFLKMFDVETLRESSECVLSTIGKYYGADRMYILEPAENGRVVTMPYEWTSENKRSIQKMVTGSPTKSFPLITRCMQENQPIFISRSKNAAGMEDENSVWRFAIFPMYYGKKIESFLCIENSAREIPDSGFVELLISCLQRIRGKYKSIAGAVLKKNSAVDLDLPNYKTYSEVINSYSSDVYTSLGAVCVDVPSYSVINSTQGFEEGRMMLWKIVQSLKENFGSAMLFRTWDAEFVALCPNTTHEAFSEKYDRLYGHLKRRYPSDLRMGRAWSDKIFSGKDIVEDAKLLMRCESRADNQIDAESLPESLAKYGTVRDMTAAGRFIVHYQPKVDMESGRIVGAEALVRGIDENEHIISPAYFVDELERSGAIRDLDLFVLDYTLRMLDDWQEEGIPLIPISVNFSRVTLFDPRVSASVMAIQSRYPTFKKGTVEIEITESATDVNREDMIDIMDSYREMGFEFAMDDFGSKYSNLAAFTSIKFETVKLDRSLVHDVVSNKTNRMLIKDIADICAEKNVLCVAEGVETLDQIKALQKCGCSVAQGFYFHRPLSAELFKEKYIKQQGI